MVGKKNIVFGFLYLVCTAALGPYMVIQLFPAVGEAEQAKKEHVGRLQQLAENEYEENLQPLTAEQIAKANTKGILSINQINNARAPIDSIKGGAHAHGNLEALLNIAAGVVLCFVAAPMLLKQLVSWLFIVGALLHSGMLYLLAFEVSWAGAILPIGPYLVLAALLLMGIVALIWFTDEVVAD